MTEKLYVFCGQQKMGHLLRNRKRDRLAFHYDEDWRLNLAAFPLSLSMPLAAAEHGHEAVESFLWGLLPDNEGVLQRWGAKFQVSPKNPFALLGHVGEDCAGAVQFVRPELAEAWQKESPKGDIIWLTYEEVAERMALLQRDHGSGRAGADAGQFSLAGAQPKTAYYYDEEKKRWGVPSGSVPTTHILKPAVGTFDGLAENEHFCLRLARECGLSTASSVVQYFGDCPVIVVERYDRIRRGGRVLRIHQEDMCQALGCRPHQKYQNQGGPSASQILDLIRQYSANRVADEQRFVDALILGWLIGATDAHAKNFSLLIASGAQIRLAPLYDISSALPYPEQVDLRRAGLAMKIGGAYKLREIGIRNWEKFAKEAKMDASDLSKRIVEVMRTLPEKAHSVAARLCGEGIKHPVIELLTEEIAVRVLFCQRQFGA